MSSWRPPRDPLTELKDARKRLKRKTARAYDPDDRPGPIQNVVIDFRVREKKTELRYIPFVTWDPIPLGACAADIDYYDIQIQPTDSDGNPKENARKKWNQYVVKDPDDLEVDELKIFFHDVEHPKKVYWRARVRAIDKDDRKGEWSDWSEHLLPHGEANPSPPPPVNVTMIFDKQEKGRHGPRYRGKVRFPEIPFWDVPPTTDRSKVETTLAAPLAAGANEMTLTSVANIPAPNSPKEPLSITLRRGKPEREVVSYTGKDVDAKKLTGLKRGLEGTSDIAHPNEAKVVLPASDAMEKQNDLSAYIVQIRKCDSNGNFLRDENNKFVQRTKSHSWRSEDDDADSVVQCTFAGLHKKYFWKARARTRDRYGRRGEWSDWSNLANPVDSEAPPQPNGPITITVKNNSVHVDWEHPPDPDDPDIQHEDVAYYQVELHSGPAYSASTLVKKDYYHHGTKKAFDVKRSVNHYYARTRSVDGSGNKSAWLNSNQAKLRPPQPTPPTIAFDDLEKEKGAKLRAVVSFTYDEGGYVEDFIDRYVVQAIVTSGSGFVGNEPRKTRRVEAQGDDGEGDANDPKAVVYKGVPRRKWIRARVRAIDKDNRKSPWSSWSSSYQITDTTAPPNPTSVSIESDVKGVFVDWEPPLDPDDSENAHPDVDHYQVEAHGNSSFTNLLKRDRHVVMSKKRFKGLSEGGVYYARVRSVGSTGTKSGWIGSNGVVTAAVVDHAALGIDAVHNDNVFIDAIGPSELADEFSGPGAAVGTIHLQNLAVTDAKINNLSADKLTAGTITARKYQTASGGTRVVIADTSNGNDRVNFYDGNGWAASMRGAFGRAVIEGGLRMDSPFEVGDVSHTPASGHVALFKTPGSNGLRIRFPNGDTHIVTIGSAF